MKKIFDQIVSFMEDSAATADDNEISNLAHMLGHLQTAAEMRCSGVRYRADGKVNMAMNFEQKSEQLLGFAKRYVD